MHTSIFKVAIHPNQLAVCKSESHILGGVFFLDFSRPIVIYRKLGFIRYLGVPVVHECQQEGGFVISVHKKDPNFTKIRKLWKEHYPSTRTAPSYEADGPKIISDFAKQFPPDAHESE
jgi:hypothetical protein